MKEKVKIDIVSDVVCPWCVIGYKRLKRVLRDMGIEDMVEIEFHPYELNQDIETGVGEELYDHMERKYGATVQESRKYMNTLVQHGVEEGFTFNFFEGMEIVNTLDAHILLEYANETGKQVEFKLRLFTAYFSDGKDISDRNILLKEAQHIGIDIEAAKKRLNNEECRQHVRDEELKWREHGVTAVPTIYFNKSEKLIGAQPDFVYRQMLSGLSGENSEIVDL